MHRIIVAFALASVLVGASTAIASTHHVRHHVKQARSALAIGAATCPNPGACGTACPHGGSGASASGASVHARTAGAACPVSDPSACPASCRRTGTASVAANTAAH